MSKLIALAAVVGAVLIPAAANAATATTRSGVVVAKEAARHTLIVASPSGKVTTVRGTTRQVRTTLVGSRISAVGTLLADGSLHANRITRSGTTRNAHIVATVLKATRTKLLVAGGGSAFAIRLNAATHVTAAPQRGPKAGQKIDSHVKLSRGGLVGSTVHGLGPTTLVDFSGKVTALDSTSLTIMNDGVSSVVSIPDGFSLPPLVKIGSEVEIVASVTGSALALVSIKLDGDGAETGDDGGSSVSDDGTVHVEGFVTLLGTDSITIQPGHSASPITFAIPDGFTLPAGLAAGSRVEARGDVVSAVLTLTRLVLQSDESGSGEIETEGTVTGLDSGSITIQPAESGTPLTFTIPDGFTLPDGLKIGSIVSAKGDIVSSVLTLTKLELEDSGDGGGDG